MSFGEQKEQRGRGDEGGGSNTNWVGPWRDRSVLGCWLFFWNQRKQKGSGQVPARPMTSSRAFSQCPSLWSASGEHSLGAVLQNALLSTGGFFSFSFSPLLGFPRGSGASLPPG